MNRLAVSSILLAIPLAVGCAAGGTSNKSSKSSFLSPAGRVERRTDFTREVAKCMKQRGFEFRTPPVSQRELDTDFATTVDPRTMLRSVGDASQFAIPIAFEDVEASFAAAYLFGATDQNGVTNPSVDQVGYLNALVGVGDKPGCVGLANKKFGGWSVADAQERMNQILETPIASVRTDELFREADKIFAACSKARGENFSSLLSVQADRRIILFDLIDKHVKDGESLEETFSHAEQADKTMFLVYKDCSRNVRDNALQAMDKYWPTS